LNPGKNKASSSGTKGRRNEDGEKNAELTTLTSRCGAQIKQKNVVFDVFFNDCGSQK
jgi:hypothetical protein